MENDIDAVMLAIHALVPLDGGSSWSTHVTPKWPDSYTPEEVQLRRAIATAAALALQPPPGYCLVPLEPTDEQIRAMSGSRARDDEGEFPPLFDLLDFSGEHKTVTVLREAYRAMIAARPENRNRRFTGSHVKREPVEATPRRQMTKARRARILARSDGHCAYPGCEEAAGLEIDHIVCLELGGADEDWNLEALCDEHHKAKTRRDAKMIAKARRLRKKSDPATRKPAQMKAGRKLQGARFRKDISRGFDGKVRPRGS